MEQDFISSEGIRSAAARGRAPAAHGDGPAGRGPKNNKILFFGNGPLADYALETLKNSFDIVFHARTRQDLDRVRRLKRDHPEYGGILASYGVIVPQDILDLFEPQGIFNIHPSLLPKYRGPSPIETAILDGAKDFSVSIMKLAPKMDAGPLYYQTTLKNLPLDKNEIYKALATEGAEWLNKNFVQLPPLYEQQGEPTFTRKFEKQDSHIDPATETAEQIYRKIVAFQGFPKVKYAFYGVNCAILAAHPLEQGGTAPLTIKCQDGQILAIDRLQPDGKKPMDAKSFLNGYGRK